VAHEIAGRPEIVQALDEAGARPLAVRGDDARHLVDPVPVVLDREHEGTDGRLALALEYTIDRTTAVVEDRPGSKRGAMPAHEHESLRQA
jgi:hypothetical protein